jgi:hypothetical protein
MWNPTFRRNALAGRSRLNFPASPLERLGGAPGTAVRDQMAPLGEGGTSTGAAKFAGGGGTGMRDFMAPLGDGGIGTGTKTPRLGAGKVLGSFKKGGTVPKTGDYHLEAGEEVIPVDEAEEAGGKSTRRSEYRKVYLERKKKKV